MQILYFKRLRGTFGLGAETLNPPADATIAGLALIIVPAKVVRQQPEVEASAGGGFRFIQWKSVASARPDRLKPRPPVAGTTIKAAGLLAGHRSFRVAVDQSAAPPDAPLKADSEVAIFPPVTGG